MPISTREVNAAAAHDLDQRGLGIIRLSMGHSDDVSRLGRCADNLQNYARRSREQTVRKVVEERSRYARSYARKMEKEWSESRDDSLGAFTAR